MTKSTGVGRGGLREPRGGRPKGSKTKLYKPHVEKALAARPGMLPKEFLLDVMRRHYRAKRYDEAARVASMVAPYIHPRLSSANVTVKPSLEEIIAQASPDELDALEAEGLAAVKPKGNA